LVKISFFFSFYLFNEKDLIFLLGLVLLMILVSGFCTGVPNTLNVITNFPFLVVGVLGLVLALEGGFFTIRLVSYLSLLF
jgi:hypothetical protein